MDLATEWRARRWRKLLDIIDRLPRHSAYIEALTEDELIAERMIDDLPTDGKPQRRMSEYSPVVELLSLLADRIAELIGTVAASSGVKPRKIPPAPRPVTAVDRLRQRRRHATHRFLVSKMLPKKAADTSAGEQQPALPQRPQPQARRPLPNPPPRTNPRVNRSGWSSP